MELNRTEILIFAIVWAAGSESIFGYLKKSRRNVIRERTNVKFNTFTNTDNTPEVLEPRSDADSNARGNGIGSNGHRNAPCRWAHCSQTVGTAPTMAGLACRKLKPRCRSSRAAPARSCDLVANVRTFSCITRRRPC